jgi:hypothetical protein
MGWALTEKTPRLSFFKTRHKLFLMMGYSLIITLIAAFSIHHFYSHGTKEPTIWSLDDTSLADYETFNITTDDDFETLDLPGNGTNANPYRITHYDISGKITLSNITKSLAIHHCHVRGGIAIANITETDITISNNIIKNIILQNVTGATIDTNHITQGILSLKKSQFISIYNNFCDYTAIHLDASNSCLITYNLLYRSPSVCLLLDWKSSYSLIHHNTFYPEIGWKTGGEHIDNFGENNTFYDPESQEGNYYYIEAPYGMDPYPLNEPTHKAPKSGIAKTADELVWLLPFFLIAILWGVFLGVPWYYLRPKRKQRTIRDNLPKTVIFCGQCGATYPSSSRYCRYCGVQLQTHGFTIAETNSYSGDEQKSNTPKAK